MHARAAYIRLQRRALVRGSGALKQVTETLRPRNRGGGGGGEFFGIDSFREFG